MRNGLCRDFITEKGGERASSRYQHLCASKGELGRTCRVKHLAAKHTMCMWYGARGEGPIN